MILDTQNSFTWNSSTLTDDQAITVTAASTNVIDLGADRDIGKGIPVPILVQATAAFTAVGAATLTVALQTDDNASFSSASTVWTSTAIPKATLVQGYEIPINYVPRENERYLRLYFTVATGPMTAGTIVAGITGGDQDSFSG